MTPGNMSDDHSIDAINHVLRAEAESKEAVEVCRKEAMEIIDDGRATARRIINRIDNRITSLHARSDHMVNERVRQIHQEIDDLSHIPALDEDTHDDLQAAVSMLLDEMTGTTR